MNLELRTAEYDWKFALLNPQNYDLHRKICWKLAKNYFKKSVVENGEGFTFEAYKFIDRAIQMFRMFKEDQEKIEKDD